MNLFNKTAAKSEASGFASPDQAVAALKSALSLLDLESLRVIARRLRKKEPLLYALLSDCLEHAIRGKLTRQSTGAILEVVDKRVESLKNWNPDENETVAALRSGTIDPAGIKPHVRLEAAEYDRFYSDQSKRYARSRAPAGLNEQSNYIEVGLGSNVNHAFRHTHAITLAETLLGMAGILTDGDEAIRWLDIGCGTGTFANGANPQRFGLRQYEIVGCDLQEGKISVANRRRARGRTFFTSDAFQMLEQYKTRGEHFQLVSMFEFLEHLDDPLRFIRQLDTFSPLFVLAASPLEQTMHSPFNAKPDRAHLWSFSRRGWEQMFESAGFEVVYSSEVRVGSYLGGLDWLSIACGPRKKLRERRESLQAVEDDTVEHPSEDQDATTTAATRS